MCGCNAFAMIYMCCDQARLNEGKEATTTTTTGKMHLLLRALVTFFGLNRLDARAPNGAECAYAHGHK